MDMGLTFIPQFISDFLGRMGDESEKESRIDEFVRSLEDEMRKIDAFKREPPLCVLLLNDGLKKKLLQSRKSKAELKFEEFIPLKKPCLDVSEEIDVTEEDDCGDKSNWMSSMQLWTSDFSISTQRSKGEIKQKANEEKNPLAMNDPCQDSKNRCPFGSSKSRNVCKELSPFKEDKGKLSGFPRFSCSKLEIKNSNVDFGKNFITKSKISEGVSSSTVSDQSNTKTGQQHLPQQQQVRGKRRRWWSPELHRRFVNALEQLGGSQVATPMLIRQFMQVDGVTIDEVKSH